ncbi:catalase HPII [Salmonella enterica subsp. enterica serovar 4,[5],12:i:-]|nr:catalase HPII [Salmonella enterica subsp. enterica serovar 4,[5],12:i:-]
MSHNEKSPHQSPVHDTRESQPGLDSLAPSDGSHRPTPETTPPGAQPTAPGSLKAPETANDKLTALDAFRKGSENYALTTNQGVRIADDQNSLRAGSRGPTLLEDFILREKITHFDHGRIPERIVHARGSAAHGYFQPYKDLSDITKAAFLCDPQKITPVFVRFSTVQGGAGSAHDTFWDYVSLQPETLHNVMWAMSDRGIPRSYRTMEGFGIHTFRLINAQGKATFVRFHWKPLAGKASLVWDESQKLTGRDPDFHRRDLWEAIEAGDFPEYELGLQLIAEEDEFKFDFDLLDPTKLIPEELVPVQRVGKMVLNRNPDNFFAENEQAAFHPGHIVPGIDFTNDPLLQGRLFSYTDTQISRLGGPNFHEIPINRPTCPYHNFQRDGMHRMDIDTNPANYEPNSINDNWPRETPPAPKRGGFESYQERVDGNKIRERSPSFGEYYSHPRLFWLSQTPIEQQHIIDAFSFELGKVARAYIRERVVDQLAHIDVTLAQGVAHNLGFALTHEQTQIAPPPDVNGLKKDPALSLYAVPDGDVKGRVVAILLNDKVNAAELLTILQALKAKGVHAKLLYSRMGEVTADDGSTLTIAATFAGAPSLTVDAVIVPCGNIADIESCGDARYYLLEAYKHLKPIALAGDARRFKALLNIDSQGEEGLVEADNVDHHFMDTLLTLMAAHRVWSRAGKINAIPA